MTLTGDVEAVAAPDEHWLLVKNFWLPIENRLDALGAVGEDAREKIDSLNGKLPSAVIDQLHYLRKERNALLHKNRPLDDPGRWEVTAKTALSHIEGHVTPNPVSSEASPVTRSFERALSGNRSWSETFQLLLWIAVWGAVSWGVKEGCNVLFTKVNQFSAAWWLIAIVWVLCWPGIIVAGITVGLIGLVVGLAYWLISYFVSHPF